MSNRLGRNPFDKRPSSKKTPAAPAPAKVAAQAKVDAEEITGELIDIGDEEETDITAVELPGLLTKLLVDLPADAYVLSLKARLLARTWFK